jgi:hypothetical protein
MMQYNLKPGLWKFGERGAKATVSEMTHLHIMDTWTVIDPEQLTKEDKARALMSLLFLKEKWWMMQKDQGARLHKWSATESVHPQKRCGVTHCFDRISIYHIRHCREWEEAHEMLWHSEHFSLHGRGWERADGAERRTSWDDGAHCAANIAKAHNGQQKAIGRSLREVAEGTLWTCES